MSLLVILLPPRPRGGGLEPPADYAWVLANDALVASRQGRDQPSALPRADTVLAVVPDADLAWHRVAVPKAPSSRLREALGAVLEDMLLDDDEAVHLALEPGLAGGQTGWVAVGHKAWLQAVLGPLDAAGVAPERVLPSSWPSPDASLHALPADGGETGARVVSAGIDGVQVLRLAGSLVRQRAAAAAGRGPVRLTAHPAAAAEAERWFESPVAVLGDAERALQATRSGWNLRQFDLAPQHRGLRALRQGLRRLGGPTWRPLRIGLAALVLVQIVGLNVAAWRLERAVQDKHAAMTRLLQTAHPQVRSVLDAPAQMQNETERLRAAAGRAGPGDLEPLLAAAANAWPDGQPPLQALRFEPGRLTVTPSAWGDAQRASFAERARAGGYRAEAQPTGPVVISRGAGS